VGEIDDTDNMLTAIGIGLRQGSYIPILFISLIASMPFADRPSCRGHEGFYTRISHRGDGIDSSFVYRRVNEFRMSIVAQCDVAHTEAVEDTQDAVATTDLVQPFYANETRNTAGPKRLGSRQSAGVSNRSAAECRAKLQAWIFHSHHRSWMSFSDLPLLHSCLPPRLTRARTRSRIALQHVPFSDARCQSAQSAYLLHQEGSSMRSTRTIHAGCKGSHCVRQ
jgi:hypothetical protein